MRDRGIQREREVGVVIKPPPHELKQRFRGHFIWTDRRSYGVSSRDGVCTCVHVLQRHTHTHVLFVCVCM